MLNAERTIAWLEGDGVGVRTEPGMKEVSTNAFSFYSRHFYEKETR